MATPINPVRGEEHYNAKLTEDDVRLIRRLIEERDGLRRELASLTNERIAEKFDVHPNVIWKIANYGSWVHVQ